MEEEAFLSPQLSKKLHSSITSTEEFSDVFRRSFVTQLDQGQREMREEAAREQAEETNDQLEVLKQDETMLLPSFVESQSASRPAMLPLRRRRRRSFRHKTRNAALVFPSPTDRFVLHFPNASNGNNGGIEEAAGYGIPIGDLEDSSDEEQAPMDQRKAFRRILLRPKMQLNRCHSDPSMMDQDLNGVPSNDEAHMSDDGCDYLDFFEMDQSKSLDGGNYEEQQQQETKENGSVAPLPNDLIFPSGSLADINSESQKQPALAFQGPRDVPPLSLMTPENFRSTVDLSGAPFLGLALSPTFNTPPPYSR